MTNELDFDVFLSFAHEDTAQVRRLYDELNSSGLRVFWADREIHVGKSFSPQLQDALPKSQHFVLYCTKTAAKSEWVAKEWQVFLDTCHLKDKDNRLMYVLPVKDCTEEDIPTLLKDIQRPKTTKALRQELVKGKIRQLQDVASIVQETCTQEAREKNEQIAALKTELSKELSKVAEAQTYYRHHRFWSGTAENGAVHIFTCGRDVSYKADTHRGYGGRTNIDMWDYRAVLDITHFFASSFPNTQITIEDPISKLQGNDLDHAAHLGYRMTQLSRMLEDKDCIIVGSPDVSDFAEIVLADIHGIDPYTERRDKMSGFVIIKREKYTKSSFYWQTTAEESEGVAQIMGPGDYKYFPQKLAQDDGSLGTMHGILISANNPFCKEGMKRRIIILSGYSGVATNAIAKLLTDTACLPEFFKFDNALTSLERDIEALVRVEYVIDDTFGVRDSRRIERVVFEGLVEI